MKYRVFLLALMLQFFACNPDKDSCEDNCSEEASDQSASSPSASETETVVNLTAPMNLADGVRRFANDRSTILEWDSVVGAVSYEIAIGSSAGDTDVLDWQDVGNVNVYEITNLTLSAGTYYPSFRAVGPNQEKGPSSTADGWVVETCPTGYIPVPGDTTTGLGGAVYSQGTQSNYNWDTPGETIRDTADFCVMKYEAKDGGSHTAVSTASGLPWVEIARELAGADNDAQEACENNGSNYQLIGNHHWQAIARNIESVSVNYGREDGDTTDGFNRGQAFGLGQSFLAASTDDSLGCFGVTDNSDPDDDCGNKWNLGKRTHTLSNDEVIWDLSGNAAEWVRDDDNSGVVTGSPQQAYAYTVGDLQWYGPKNTYDSPSNLGQYVAVTANVGVTRGANRFNGFVAGIFAAQWRAVGTPSAIDSVGFRCVYAP